MAKVNRDVLIPLMDTYRSYLGKQKRDANARLLSNIYEDYKRDIAKRAKMHLATGSWTESQIGDGTIGSHVIKAVQNNRNLVGRFQVSGFVEKVKENYQVSEGLLYELYHERKDQDCFERICRLFGRKYDLVAYLYFIIDPQMYLPLRSSVFDKVFHKIGVNIQTTAQCSWNNYQEFIDTVADVRDAMKEYYNDDSLDLLDAHSFLWTLNLDSFISNSKSILDKEAETVDVIPKNENDVVFHKNHGKGFIVKYTDNNVYVDFDGKQLIFPYPEAFDKGYLSHEPSK